jgi:catechol 2,3-dioxygenase-like lactoylglutathione lyase family enzyme
LTPKAFLGIDHVVLRVLDAKPLFGLLTERLGLPIVWPLEEAAFATFGWVGVGNTNLEIWAASSNADIPAHVGLPLIHGFALEPDDLAGALATLEAQGIRCKPPRAYQTQDGEGQLRTNFTNSVVLDVSSDSCCVFFCEWGADAPITPWQKGLTTRERRSRERNVMQACGGGPLGIVGLAELRMAVPDLPRALQKWQRLTASPQDRVLLAPDITLQLEDGRFHVITELGFAVRDLDVAKAWLTKAGLPATETGRGLLIPPEATGGLGLRLLQA